MECSITGVWTVRRKNGMEKIPLNVLWFGEALEQTGRLRYTSATGTWIPKLPARITRKLLAVSPSRFRFNAR